MITLQSEYCPYCTKQHYRIEVGPRAFRYGCRNRIQSWEGSE